MLKEYMVSLGYDENDVDRMRNTYPVIRCGDEYLCLAIKEIFDVLIKFGYTKSQIIKLTLARPHIFCYGTDVITTKLNHYKNLLGSKKMVIKVTLDFPTLLSYSLESVTDKIDGLKELGYTDEIIMKNIKVYPGLLGLSIEDTIKKMLNELKKIGFSNTSVLKITSKNMSIFGRDIQSIENAILKMESYGYTHEDVLSMITRYPSILNFSITRLDERINDMVSLGFDYNDVLKMIKINPSLFGNDMDTIRDKKVFYDSIGLFNLFVISPEDLIQGISKSYARYMYLKSIGIDILEYQDGYKMLFIGEKKFKSKYKVETADLVSMYNVDEYMKDVKTRKLV